MAADDAHTLAMEALERRIAELERRLDARAASPPLRRRPASRGHVLASVGLLALLVVPLALAGDSGRELDAQLAGNARGEPVELQVRNRSRAETGLVTASDDYALRLSNVEEGGGGGAVYGCRAPDRPPGNNLACLYADNLRGGKAFLFRSREGPTVGHFDLGNPAGPPFTTNATGVVENLNADKVDGLDAAQLLAAGPPGPQGPQGAQGPPGPTASAFASRGSPVTIVGFGQNSILEAEITLETESRVLAMAALTLEGAGGNDDEAVCRVREGTSDLGAATLTTIPDTVVDTMGTSVSGAAVMAPGTHTIELTCNKGNGATDFDVTRANLLVWAAAV